MIFSHQPQLQSFSQRFTSPLFVVFIISACFSYANNAFGKTVEISPSNADKTCDEEFENVANSLAPGDVLVLHGGTYSQSCRRFITVHGTPDNVITIKAADPNNPPLLTRPKRTWKDQNNIEIDAEYLIIDGLRFQGGGSGVRILRGNDITIQNSEIFETNNNALRVNDSSVHNLIVRHNHIHHTGLNAGSEGEGMYLGCHNGSCSVSNSLIEKNYIHHLSATSGGGSDGIEVKHRSYGNIIRDNVIHDTNIGTQQSPCIFVYGGGTVANTVEKNVMWNCGEGIYAVSDAVVQNNIVFNSLSGLTSYAHNDGPAIRKNLTLVNNTVYGHTSECAYLNWNNVTGAIFANNALYCPNSTAVETSGLADATISSNYVQGGIFGDAAGHSGFVLDDGQAPAFVAPANQDFWPAPGSLLRGTADTQFIPADDFNGTTRSTGGNDVGAYETQEQEENPGWVLGPGFKGEEPIPGDNGGGKGGKGRGQK
ncbi:MAG: hypothetical protein AB7G75_10810 [Candidatus Binatia bacterium]